MSDDEEEPRPDHIVGNQNILAAINEALYDSNLSVIEALEIDANDLAEYHVSAELTLIEGKYVLRKVSVDGKVAYRLFKYEEGNPRKIEVTTFYPPDDENETWRVEIFDTSEDMAHGVVMKIKLDLFLNKSGISTPPPEKEGGTRRARKNSGRVGGRVSAGGLRSKAGVGSATRVSRYRQSRVSRRRALRPRRTSRVLPRSRK